MWKKKSSKFADRGKGPEKVVHEELLVWESLSPHREINRLVDSRAARRIIAAAKADFDFYSGYSADAAWFGLIEVKSTEHEYRLARAAFPQYAAMLKRAKCGGLCPVLVFHSELKKWRIADVVALSKFGDKGSWNLKDYALYERPAQALKALYPAVF